MAYSEAKQVLSQLLEDYLELSQLEHNLPLEEDFLEIPSLLVVDYLEDRPNHLPKLGVSSEVNQMQDSHLDSLEA